MKNDSAPISKIPPEVFSIIPEYFGGDDEDEDEDEDLITMTHVCRGWRELLITRPSLWTHLHCKNIDRTRVYIERSKSAPLELSLFDAGRTGYLKNAFLLAVPHVSRIKSLDIDTAGNLLQNLTPHLSCPAPLLSELTITYSGDPIHVLDTTLFNGNLPSLSSLSLWGVITHLPWKNLPNLTTFKLYHVPEGKTSVTQLLNFFEGAHYLRDIALASSMPTSDAPPGRVVSLPHLKKLYIYPSPVHSILLNHLCIPAGASLTLGFDFAGDESPVPEFLPKTLENLGNVFPSSSVNLLLDKFHKCVRLSGPNGGLFMFFHWIEEWQEEAVFTLDRRVLRSLSRFDLSGTQSLMVTQYKSPTLGTVEESAPYYILSRMKDLQTLTLSQCNNLPFILALNPDQSSSKSALCPKLEEVVLYVEGLESFNIKELVSMAKERASAGKKLSSITVVALSKLVPRKNVFGLKEHVTRVDYRIGEKPPRWNGVPGDEDD